MRGLGKPGRPRAPVSAAASLGRLPRGSDGSGCHCDGPRTGWPSSTSGRRIDRSNAKRRRRLGEWKDVGAAGREDDHSLARGTNVFGANDVQAAVYDRHPAEVVVALPAQSPSPGPRLRTRQRTQHERAEPEGIEDAETRRSSRRRGVSNRTSGSTRGGLPPYRPGSRRGAPSAVGVRGRWPDEIDAWSWNTGGRAIDEMPLGRSPGPSQARGRGGCAFSQNVEP